jgi:hypothetical protein
MKGFDKAGYRIDLVHVNVAPDEAFRRMIGRYRERLIPLEYFNTVGDKPRQTYYVIKKEGLAHETVEIDANGPLGQHVITDGADTKLASFLRSEQPDFVRRRDGMGVDSSDRRPPKGTGS